MGEDKDSLGGEGQEAAGAGARQARRAAFETATAGENLGEAAERIGDGIRGAAESLIDEQKARVADLAHGFANALRRSADAFSEEGSGVVARYADDVAEQIDHLSDTVRHEHWRDLVANVEDTARRRPELFLVGAIAAGFVAGRLLTGAAPRDSTES